MKLRNTGSDSEVELQMTPMIDIVFQLLAFFIITFKVVSLEGDFNIKMPLASSNEVSNLDFSVPITIKLYAADDGRIADIVVNDTHRFGNDYAALSAYMIDYLTDPNAGEFDDETEVEFDCDFDLRYEEVINAVTAVTGYKKDGEIITLVEKIRFKDNGQTGGGG